MTRFISRFENLIRTSEITGVDRIVCGDPACLWERYRLVIVDGEGHLICDRCERVSVVFEIPSARDAGRN
jgi:hypothetical protein